MKHPTPTDLFRALDETWPPARFIQQSPWTLRQGAGGGQRVSAATVSGPIGEDDIPAAEDGMRGLDQQPLFMIKTQDNTLDQWLCARGYDVVDPVAIYVMRVGADAATRSGVTRGTWPPPDDARKLWANGGIGPDRVEVMERAEVAKTALVAHDRQRCLGVAFVAVSCGIAMLHALEVSPSARRRGIATAMMQSASHWAGENGAPWLSVMVTRANQPANALYRGLGMVEVGKYHYRRAPQAKS